jgi:hypothetical protein
VVTETLRKRREEKEEIATKEQDRPYKDFIGPMPAVGFVPPEVK